MSAHTEQSLVEEYHGPWPSSRAGKGETQVDVQARLVTYDQVIQNTESYERIELDDADDRYWTDRGLNSKIIKAMVRDASGGLNERTRFTKGRQSTLDSNGHVTIPSKTDMLMDQIKIRHLSVTTSYLNVLARIVEKELDPDRLVDLIIPHGAEQARIKEALSFVGASGKTFPDESGSISSKQKVNEVEATMRFL